MVILRLLAMEGEQAGKNMNKRLLIILSIIVLIIAIAGAIIIWKSTKERTTIPPPSATTPLSGFPVSAPITNPAPTTTEQIPIPTTPSPTTTIPMATITANQPTKTSGLLTKLSSVPISGAVLTPRVSSTTPAVLIYIEENTGNLFRVIPDGQNSQQLTNSALPGVARAWWGIYKNTLTLLAQYPGPQETPVTFRGAYNLKLMNLANTGSTTTVPTELMGAAIPRVLAGGIAVSTNHDRFFSLLDTDTGVIGTITELVTGKVKNIFSSPLKSWSVSWPAPNIIALAPRAAAGVPGALYFLNPDTGWLARILGGQSGLTTLANGSGTRILYNQELGDLKLFSTRDGGTRSLTVATLPEKCVWAADTVTVYCAVPNILPVVQSGQTTIQYPDDWWSGEAAFNDSFWRINTDTGEGKIVYADGSTGGGNRLDAINLILDEIGQRLIFTDRWSAMLWSLDLR